MGSRMAKGRGRFYLSIYLHLGTLLFTLPTPVKSRTPSRGGKMQAFQAIPAGGHPTTRTAHLLPTGMHLRLHVLSKTLRLFQVEMSI